MSESAAAKIRLALVVPDGEVPRWLRNLVARLEDVDYIDLVAITAVSDCERAKSQPLLRLWKRFDEQLFLRNTPTELRTELATGLDATQAGVLIAELQLPDVDIVGWFCPQRPPPELLAHADVWTIAGACRLDFGLADFISQQPAAECHIVRFGRSGKDDAVLMTGAATTDKLSLCRGLIEFRAIANSLFIAALCRRRMRAEFSDHPVQDNHVRPGPGLLRFVFGLAWLYGRYCVGYPRRFFSFDQWQMAYRIGGDRLDQAGLKRLAPDHGGFWADPFAIEHDGRKILFFEEFSSDLGRGHISAMELGSDDTFGEPDEVLVCPYHLSYPFVFEFEGSLYMIPESAEAGRVEAFRCTQFPDTWESHATLVDDVHAYDTTLVEHDGRWWMFMTVQRHGNSPNDELHLYYAESPFNTWTPHPLNPVSVDVRHSRPAGQLYRDNGKLYRPAQDCSGRYGRAIVIREVRRMTTTEYEEVAAYRISAAWAGDAHATHTINQSAGLTVYDCEVRARRR